jgi:hypothetical protein
MEPQEWDKDSEEYKENFARMCDMHTIARTVPHDDALKEMCRRHKFTYGNRLSLVYQDEANFSTRETPRRGWKHRENGHGGNIPAKDNGRSVMCSDFICEEKGYVNNVAVFSMWLCAPRVSASMCRCMYSIMLSQ